MEQLTLERFAARLTELREARGYTARDLSLDLGFAHNYINSIEKGKNFPTMQNFAYICDLLHVTPSEFFDFDTQDPILDKELYKEIKKLDTKAQQNILEIVRGMIRGKPE